MKLPKTRRRWLLRNEWVIDAASVLPAIGASLIGGLKLTDQFAAADARSRASDGGALDPTGLYYIWAGFLLTFLIAVVRAMLSKAKGREAADRESPKDLLGCCTVMRAVLVGSERPDGDDSLRITLYRFNKGNAGHEAHLEQLIPYAQRNGEASGDPGRKVPIACGIIGRAAREREPFVAGRVSQSVEEFRAEMVAKWGFTPEQAESLNIARWSWMAVPLLDRKGRVVGVIYLDAATPGYFTDQRKADVLAGCAALNEYAQERYP